MLLSSGNGVMSRCRPYTVITRGKTVVGKAKEHYCIATPTKACRLDMLFQGGKRAA